MKLKTGKKSGLKYFNIQDLRSWEPYYDPSIHLKEDWRGTAIDILKNESIPFSVRIWVVCRNELVSNKTMRLFAVWCYRETLKVLPNQDPRSIECVNVAERYANGLATDEELLAARDSVAGAMVTSWSAASEASAMEVALASAYSAARKYARTAAMEVALASAYSTSAWEVAKKAQRDKLIEMIRVEGQEYIRLKNVKV